MGQLYCIKGKGDNARQMFIKGVDEEKGEVLFTEKSSEAKDYGGEYFTGAQKRYLKFHFSKKYPELKNLKELESDVLKLEEVLVPLSSSFTQSSSSSESDGERGAPEKALEEKSEKTIMNEDAIDHQGGSND
jgi:hypothetical protein